MSRGACWLVACLVLLPLGFLQAFRLQDPVPLPGLHALGGGALIVFVLGYFVFDRLRDTLAEEV